jgi:hypothetical protein
MKYDYIMAAIMLSTVAVYAAPSGAARPVEKRDKNPKYSPFTQCIRNSLPNFPAEGRPSAKQAKDCMESTQPHAKREQPDNRVWIWEPEEKRSMGHVEDLGGEGERGSIQSRDIVDKLFTLGKNLFLDTKSNCVGTQAHDDFLFNYEIKDKLGETCRQLQQQIDTTGIKEDGGIGFLVDKVTNGHDKQGSQLVDKRALTVTYLLSFYPPAGMAINDIKTLAAGVNDFCNDAILRLGSFNEEGGCLENMKYFRPSKGKTFHEYAQIGGDLQIKWDGKRVGAFSMDFSEDG